MNEHPDTSGTAWSVLLRLAVLHHQPEFQESRILGREPSLEECLRRVLRPHDEVGFQSRSDQWMVSLRMQLDSALGDLTLREIEYELDLELRPLPDPVMDALRALFISEAFLRYLDAYLYFGVRFLASRAEYFTEPASPCADSNISSLPLAHPPGLIVERAQQQLQSLQDRLAKDNEPGSVRTALSFLDGFHPFPESEGQYGLGESTDFELWLRGLRPEADANQTKRFWDISDGLTQWSLDRSRYYLSLNRLSGGAMEDQAETEEAGARPPQGWLSTHPIAARLALTDVYWIARLLGADVSSTATVRYRKVNWLQLLRFNAIYRQQPEQVEPLKKAEEALRSVFDYVCDLVQNSIEITRDQQQRSACPEMYPPRPVETKDWRAVFDDELKEIEAQRKIRHFRDPSLPPNLSTAKAASPSSASEVVWSDRITTGERPLNLIGLAFSGGGIRSATLNLGVLQGLQELDLLRHIDYISTVSGGGFIGSWFVANIRRSAHWLGRMTDWSCSIAHLRAHSNYLAPRTGLLSADTWNIANSWLRNAFLIQLTGLAWLFVLLLLTVESMQVFFFIAATNASIVIGAIAAAIAFIAVLVNLHGTSASSKATRRNAKWVRRTAVIPACIGGYALAAHLWEQACAWANSGTTGGKNQYSDVLLSAWRNWNVLLILVLSLVAFTAISWFTLKRKKQWAVWIGPFCTGVIYLEVAGVLFLFRSWATNAQSSAVLAFVFGPPLVLASFSVSILLLIGYTGRNTNEAQREWWTRFGTWLAIFAGLALALASIAILCPHLMWRIFHTVHGKRKWLEGMKWTGVVSWIGTVVGGLLAGQSSKTGGDKSTKSPALQVLANVGGLLFILGSLISGATLLVLILYEVWTPSSIIEPLSAAFLSGLDWWKIPACLGIVCAIGSLFSRFFEINIFGLNQFYRNRLMRCYLGASRWMPGARKPNPFTGFDFRDDLDLSRFCTQSTAEGLAAKDGVPAGECGVYRGPFPLINCTLNLGGSADLALNTRHSDSFTLTPLRCGSSRPMVGYAPTTSPRGKFADGVRTGQAVAISGAAVSSNMGYNTSPVVAFLLTMFNLRLGWWFPNPSRDSWSNRGLTSSFRYLLAELLGTANENRPFLNISDGGHFENLAIYELIRRRCKLIIACDAECDEFLEFGGLGNLIRICETDFGASIELDVKSMRRKSDSNSLSHCAVGQIKYGSGEIGHLIYLKASMTGDEDVSIAQYRSSHPSFPHETTANQFFTEDQFESYRTLGIHMVRTSFKGTTAGDDPLLTAERLADLLSPTGYATPEFLKHSRTLAGIWEHFRGSSTLLPFMNELLSLNPGQPVAAVATEELCIGLQLIQLMEDVFLDLRLDEFWDHPDNRGWAFLFMRWARSPRFRKIWNDTHRTFGIRFEYFCNARLGLTRDQPITRV